MRNPSGLSDFSLGEFIIHLNAFSFFLSPLCIHRENQRESSSPDPSIVPSTPTPVPPSYPTSVVLRVVVGGLTYVYEYLLLARAGFLLVFHAMQRSLVNLTRTS